MPRPERLRVMADYSAFPVWGSGGMVDPAALPITAALRDDLAAWNDAFETTYPDGWASDEAFVAWRAAGRQLAARLQVELGALDHEVLVIYVHDDGLRAT